MHQFSNRFAGLELLSHSKQNTSKAPWLNSCKSRQIRFAKIVRRATYVRMIQKVIWKWPRMDCIAFDSFMALHAFLFKFCQTVFLQDSQTVCSVSCSKLRSSAARSFRPGNTSRFRYQRIWRMENICGSAVPLHTWWDRSLLFHPRIACPPAKAICYLAALDVLPLQDLPGQLQLSRT